MGRNKYSASISSIDLLKQLVQQAPEGDACVIWPRAKSPFGYGKVCVEPYVRDNTHRVAYKLLHGVIPDGMFVCHKCDVPSCVRGSHLFLGSPFENMHDAISKGRCRYLRGSSHIRAKLTESEVIEIYRLQASGVSQRAIGERFGVSKPTIQGICEGRHWTHVPNPYRPLK